MMDNQRTEKQYQEVIANAKEVFINKTKDYGTAWRILRTKSITDQIFIKASRIRSIEEKGVSKVDEAIDNEFLGIINYSIMALIQLDGDDMDIELSVEKVNELYDYWANTTYELMLRKNHDYGEAWRGMRVSSMTDLILMKLLRIKSIEENDGKTLVSEGLDANYMDILNYSVFALILLKE